VGSRNAVNVINGTFKARIGLKIRTLDEIIVDVADM